jgi:hypothetical protein
MREGENLVLEFEKVLRLERSKISGEPSYIDFSEKEGEDGSGEICIDGYINIKVLREFLVRVQRGDFKK